MFSEADAFLDAIWAAPDDDTPRLVYADWLDEHDQADYAQFIRLSVKADGGSKPPAKRQRLREERFPHWHRLASVRRDAFANLPLTVHNFGRGFCKRVEAKAADFLRTVETWWPVITPPELIVYAAQDREAEVVEAVGRHLPWLRKFRCDNRPGVEVHDEYYFTPLTGAILARVAAPGLFPKLRSLDIHIAYTDFTALATFAGSQLALQLDSLFVELRFSDTDEYRYLGSLEKTRPDEFCAEVTAFIEEHRHRQTPTEPDPSPSVPSP